jgi:ubiquinone/menaquinone biosynthesis C-methylase UbiE/uncharacterized protein YbaR (Trm112 family)
MEKFKHLKEISEHYNNGGNIINYLKTISKNEKNAIEDILISYDFQAGSYLKGFSKTPINKVNYCNGIAKIINDLGDVNSILEVGMGEGTALGLLVHKLKKIPQSILGLDISWSRVKFARFFFNEIKLKDAKLFTSDLFHIPLEDNSVDIVYTLHALEPNGGREEEALKELYRVANKYIILLEPAYEFADKEQKERMDFNGYVKNLFEKAKLLNYKVIKHELFGFSSNPMNPTGIMIIEKNANASDTGLPDFVCPITGCKLSLTQDNFYCADEVSLLYPILNEVPCLLSENAILAKHYKTDYNEFKAQNGIDFSDFKELID